MDKDLKRAKQLISLVHDGQLTDEEYRFLEKAVLRYPDLKLGIYQHERLHDLVGMIPSASAPAGVEERVLHAIRFEGPVKRTARIIFFPGRRFPVEAAGAIAASVIVFVIAVISFPSLVGTDREPGVVAHDTLGTSTAAVAMGEALPAVTEKTRPGAEDVALAPLSTEERHDERFMSGTSDGKSLPSPEVDRKAFSSGLSSSGVLTATGVTAEKVSKIFVPTREAPLSTAKKEAPTESIEPIGSMGSTTYFSSPSEEPELPTILLIHDSDPAKTRKDIVDKAVSLGGTVAIRDAEGKKGKDVDTPGLVLGSEGNESEGDMVSLPPEKMDELLDYLTVRYPETEKDVMDLRARKTTPFLRIDVTPVTTQ